MDLKGFEAINQALADANVTATVTPKPDEGRDVQFVTVETDVTLQPSSVLNALGNAGLMYYDGPKDAVFTYTPELVPLGVQAGSMTFEDKNDANRRMWR
jgi:hypothetical protein